MLRLDSIETGIDLFELLAQPLDIRRDCIFAYYRISNGELIVGAKHTRVSC